MHVRILVLTQKKTVLEAKAAYCMRNKLIFILVRVYLLLGVSQVVRATTARAIINIRQTAILNSRCIHLKKSRCAGLDFIELR